MIITILLISNIHAQAGDKIGNGGGLWACTTNQGELVRSQLVDLFEAKNEFGLIIPQVPNLMAQDIAKQKAKVLREKNSLLTEKINFHLAEVFKKTRFVNAILQKIDDALFRIVPLPNTCTEGKWDYLQFANFTAQDQVLIRNDLWTSPRVSELDKGALLLHEAVYRWLRLDYKDDNSIRAREIVGVLFSDLQPDEMNRRILTLIGANSPPSPLDTWACSLTNKHNHLFFLAFGETKIETDAKAHQSCEAGPDSFFCTSETALCELATSNSNVWSCIVKNTHEAKTFLGKGKTLVEAQYRAQQSCSDTSGGGFFCKDHVVCKKQ